MKLASLTSDLVYNEGKVTVKVLMETETSREIRILFKKGQLMKEHKAGFPIAVEVHQGTITFGVEGKELDLKAGDLIYLEANVPHNLFAVEDSIVRLTLSKLDKVDRVKSVVS